MPKARNPMSSLRRTADAMNRGNCGAPRQPDCVADDWGLSPGVNEGILDLCEAGVVGGVSLLATEPHVESGLDRLLRRKDLRLSLHLNLTHGPPLSRPHEVPSLCGRDGLFASLPTLARRAVSGRLSSAEAAMETRRQVRRLKALGATPTGIEGHHHVHLFPRVFSAAAAIMKEEGISWVRVPVDASHRPSTLAGAVFRAWLRLAAPPAARDFQLAPTLYLNAEDTRSPGAMDRKLLNAGGLPVIIHPARRNDLPAMDHPDALQSERVAEFRALLEWSRRLQGGIARA